MGGPNADRAGHTSVYGLMSQWHSKRLSGSEEWNLKEASRKKRLSYKRLSLWLGGVASRPGVTWVKASPAPLFPFSVYCPPWGSSSS